MRVVQINATCGVGSTGKICVAIAEMLNQLEIESYVLYTGKNINNKYGINYASKYYVKAQALKSRVIGNFGFNSKFATRKLLSILDELHPDIIHLHNLHGHNVNIEMLFFYLKEHKIKVFWTFHDCWAFTGYCTHFMISKCHKWVYGCGNCPQRKKFSWFLDKSNHLFLKKKAAYSGLDMTIIVPSKWLAELSKKSFMSDYPIKVIHNGINLDCFHPTKSNFRKKFMISQDKWIVLGVAFGWNYAKGLDIFVELSKRLDADKYQIVLVGTNERVDKVLPNNVLSIHRTSNQKELAQIYSAADVFVNPTREENYPTVNMEAIACGTPVITFNTGGCAEILTSSSGIVVNREDVDELESAILKTCEQHIFDSSTVAKCAEVFQDGNRYMEIVQMYINN